MIKVGQNVTPITVENQCNDHEVTLITPNRLTQLILMSWNPVQKESGLLWSGTLYQPIHPQEKRSGCSL